MPSSGNPYGYYSDLLYENGSDFLPETNDCLSPAAMNYYLGNLKIIAAMPQYKPIGKQIANYYCSYDYTQGIGYWYHLHFAHFTYGVYILALASAQAL